MQKLERSIFDRVRSEVGNAVSTVKARVHGTILAAMDSLVIPRVELAMKSVNVSS